jgi:hypothetical protein
LWQALSAVHGYQQRAEMILPNEALLLNTPLSPFQGINIIVDLGCSLVASPEGHVDDTVMRKIHSALRLAIFGGAARVWVAWATTAGEVLVENVRWEASAPDEGTRRDLFMDAPPGAPPHGTLVLSVANNVRDAVMSSHSRPHPSSSLNVILGTGRDGSRIPVARRSLEWWYRTILVDGVAEWARVNASLLDGTMLEWENQRPRVHTLLYEQ